MNIKQGEIVTLQHYTSRDFYKAVVVSSQDEKLSVKPQRDCTVFSYFTYDPLVLGIGMLDEVYMLECTITSINYQSNCVDLKVDNTYSLFNKRADERYPTSIYGVIVHSPIKGSVYIKNISPDGMSIKSKLNLSEGDKIEVEAYIKKTLLSAPSEIIWKKCNSNDFEYGLRLKATDESKKTINSYLSHLHNEQMSAIQNMKNKVPSISQIKSRKLLR